MTNHYRYLKDGMIVMTTFAMLAACNNSSDSPVLKKDSAGKPDSTAPAPVVKENIAPSDSSLLPLAKEVLKALDKKDYRSFANFIHPEKGILFTPYGYVDTSSDVRISRQVFLVMLSRKQPVKWGVFDGSGDDIRLTLPQYLAKFVYDAPFARPESFSLNKTLAKGNAVNNLEAIYPGLPYIESYFSGFDKKYGGLDWRSLRLVFEEFGGRYYLVALVHNQWTS